MMDWLTVAVIIAAITAGAWLLWRARCRGHARSRHLRDHHDQSRQLMREEEERWRETFGTWQPSAEPRAEDDSRQASPHVAGK